jgi:hypothetical protein
MAFNSEEEFLQSQDTGTGWTPESDYEAPKNDARLNTLNSQGPIQQGIDAAAYQQRRMTNSMKQAWYKLRGNDKESLDLQKIIDHEDKIYKNYMRSPFNEHRTASSVGNLIGGITHPVSMATMPLGGGATLPARAAIQGLIGAGTEAVTNPGTLGDRAASGGLGFVGGMVGSGIGDTIAKGWSGLKGDWIDPAMKSVNDRLVSMGLRPTIGDLARPNESSVVKAVENMYHKTSSGQQKLGTEAEKLRRLIVPNKQTGQNTVADAVTRTGKGVNDASTDIWSGFDTAIKGNVTKVRPVELKNGLDKLLLEYPQLLSQSGIPNKKIRDQLSLLAETPANKLPSMPVAEFNALRKSIGSVVASTKELTSPAAAGGVTRLDKKALGMVGDLLTNAKADMARWGNNGSNQKAYSLFTDADAKWQAEILPWKKSQLAQDLKELDNLGAPDTARRIAGESDTDAINQVQNYMKQYGGYDDANVFEALATQRRAANAMGTEAGSVIPSPTFGLGVPTHTSVAKGLYFGDPKLPNMNSPLMSVGDLLSESAKTIGRKAPISIGREFGEEELAMLMFLADSLNPVSDDTRNTDETYSHGIGHATQEGVAGR